MELDKYLGQLFEQRSRESVVVKPPAGSRSDTVPTPQAAANDTPPPVRPLGPSRDSDEERYRQVKKQVHSAIVESLNTGELQRLSDDRHRPELRAALEKVLDTGGYSLDMARRRQMVDELLDDMLGFGPLEPLLRDPNVGDILINGTWGMYVEYSGVLREIPNPFSDTAYLAEIAHRIATRIGRTVNESSPMVDARLPDGSRVHIVLPPVALKESMHAVNYRIQ